MSRAESGNDTTRMSAAEQDRAAREERRSSALRVLTRRGALDVAEILGLVDPACKSCGVRSADVGRAGYCPSKECRAAQYRATRAATKRAEAAR